MAADITTVIFGSYEIKCWYPSPYPIDDVLRDQALAAEREAIQSRLQQLDARPSKRTRHSTIEPNATGAGAATNHTTVDGAQADHVAVPSSSGVIVPTKTFKGGVRSLDFITQNANADTSPTAVLPTQMSNAGSETLIEASTTPRDIETDISAIDEHQLLVTESKAPLRLNGGSSTAHSAPNPSTTSVLVPDPHGSALLLPSVPVMEQSDTWPVVAFITDEEAPRIHLPDSTSDTRPSSATSNPSGFQGSPEPAMSATGAGNTATQPADDGSSSSRPTTKRGRSKMPHVNLIAADVSACSNATPIDLRLSLVKSSQRNGLKLYVCEGCFKYFIQAPVYAEHLRTCTTKRPPGRKVYQRGAHTIWEVDGEKAKLFCQNLALFGKLFINHKYVFFETSGFLFYVLTEARPSFDHCLGFFSKEKISYNDYNLACIVTFPPYQKRGFGTLMMEFSYELSSRASASQAGTPERPLSELGLRGYLQFWTSVLVRYFRLIFLARNDPRLVAPIHDRVASADTLDKRADDGRKKHWKGYEGEVEPVKAPAVAHIPPPANNTEDTWSMKFSLAEIANATHLREDDVAFALIHSGLANLRSNNDSSAEDPEALTDLEVVIGPAVVEAVAERFKVKMPVMSRAHCHI